MNLRLLRAREEIKHSYWFIPALMIAAAVSLSFITIGLDRQVDLEWSQLPRFFWSGGGEGARGLLSTLAGSLITVAGVIFSITIVAFSLASTQFGPRLLRNFMRDTGNQVVLGMFTSVFIYCLLILRTIRTEGPNEFVPHISINIALLMGLVTLALVIYFFHHVSMSIQAPMVVASVARELLKPRSIYPAHIGFPPPAGAHESQDFQPDEFAGQGGVVRATRSGYLQALDGAMLMWVAVKKDLLIRLLYRPGHFIIEGDEIAQVWPGVSDHSRLAREIHAAFIIGRQRTSTQDIEFAINQLVEMAVRALSPAINDPFTALTCVDWLGAALARLAGQDFPSCYRYDSAGRLRVIALRPETYTGLVESAFNQIRQAAQNHVAVNIHLLEVIQILLERTDDERYQEALFNQARMIEESSQVSAGALPDRMDIEERYKKVVETEERNDLD